MLTSSPSARKIVNVTQASASKLIFFVYFPFQTNRDLRSKDPIPSRVSKEAKMNRMGEDMNRTHPDQADEQSRPQVLKETPKIPDQSQEGLEE